jgi:hypothetical protein
MKNAESMRRADDAQREAISARREIHDGYLISSLGLNHEISLLAAHGWRVLVLIPW